MAEKRLNYVDMTRGLAIILVVFAHAEIPKLLISYIYSFHMPLFFIISGFLLPHSLLKNKGDYVKNKFKRLVIPYFIFSLVALMYVILAKKFKFDPIFFDININDLMNCTFIGRRDFNLSYNVALWFLLTLFFSEILFYVLYKICKKDNCMLAISIFGVAILGMVYNYFVKISLPWNIDVVPFALVFVGFGYFLSQGYLKFININSNDSNRQIIILFIIGIASWLLNRKIASYEKVDMFGSAYGNFFFFFTAGCSTSLAIMLLFKNNLQKFDLLSWCGKNSMIIYGLHLRVFFGIISAVFSAVIKRPQPFLPTTSMHKLANGLIYLAITLLLSWIVVKLINKYHLWKDKNIKKPELQTII